MYKFIRGLLLLLIISSTAFSQTSLTTNILLKGQVIDQQLNIPLAYTSIGIAGKPVGTVADSAGNYHLTITAENTGDSLLVSLVGYQSIKISISEISNATDKNIFLSRKNNVMEEVVITSSKTSTEIIGREKSGKMLQLALHNTKAPEQTIGSELGMKIKTHRSNALLKNLNWNISANNFNRIKFRINVYAIKNDLPDSLLSSKAIFGQIDDFKTGWIQFDLTPYDIKINGDFIITLQWIESLIEKKEKPVTLIPVGLSFAKNCYFRSASQDNWERKGIKLSYYVTLAY
jgi:hypothetical protein